MLQIEDEGFASWRTPSTWQVCHIQPICALTLGYVLRTLVSAGAWQSRFVSRASPTARYRTWLCGRGSQAGGPASEFGRDGGPRARTYSRTCSLRRATSAPNRRERTLRRGDAERPREHPTTCTDTARRFSCARRQPAS